MVAAMRRSLSVLFACALLAVPAATRAQDSPYPGYVSEIYADPAHWICDGRSGDPCDGDMDATNIKRKGQTRVERWKPARKPKFDCFYVYPTISLDETGNSDLVPADDQEIFVARQQAARLGSVCRVFAPVYRQVTLTALLGLLNGGPVTIDRGRALNDVVDAWKHYVANENDGRGVVLIGHSQGGSILTALLKQEVDGVPAVRDLVISAILLGTSFQVPVGGDVGGDLQNMPLCHSPKDRGCIITYSSFRSTAPPPATSLFGTPRGGGLQAACTNPAALGGGKGYTRPYLPSEGRSLPILPPPTDIQWVEGKTVTTPFVTLPRFLETECKEKDGFVYLEVTVHGDESDPRIDDIGGDLTPDWGLHLVDASLAMGDFVSIAKLQAKAWRKHR